MPNGKKLVTLVTLFTVRKFERAVGVLFDYIEQAKCNCKFMCRGDYEVVQIIQIVPLLLFLIDGSVLYVRGW